MLSSRLDSKFTTQRRRVVWVAGLAAIGVASYLVATSITATPSASQNTALNAPGAIPGVVDGDPLRGLFEREELLFGGQMTSEAEVEAQLKRPLPVPTETSTARVTEIWLHSGLGEVGIRYGDSVVLLYTPWGPNQDPTESYAQEAKEWGVGEPAIVAGMPALVVPANAAGEGSPSLNRVSVSADGWDIAMIGLGSIDELKEVAARLQVDQTASESAS